LPISSVNGPFTRLRPSTVAYPLANTFPASGQLVTQLTIYLDVDAGFDNDKQFDFEDVNLNRANGDFLRERLHLQPGISQ
jgi:hypothetical protein